MICRKCGAELEGEYDFCPKCGKSITGNKKFAVGKIIAISLAVLLGGGRNNFWCVVD